MQPIVTVPPREANVMRVGAHARTTAALDQLLKSISAIPNVPVRRGMVGQLHTLVVEVLHMQSNLNAHKRVIRDAIEVMRTFESDAGDMRRAMIRAWAADVQDVMDGNTADHNGIEIAAERTAQRAVEMVEASVPEVRVVVEETPSMRERIEAAFGWTSSKEAAA